MEQSRDGIVILDRQGDVVESNRKFADMLRYAPEEMSGLNVKDWDSAISTDDLEGMIEQVDEQGDFFETKHIRKDGSTYDVEISTNAAWFGDRKLIFCVCRDITERKKHEEQLRISNQRLESFLQITQTMNMTMELGQLMQLIVDNAVRVTGLDTSAIYLVQHDEHIRLEATTPALPDDFPEHFRLAGLKDHPHLARAIQTRQPVIMQDTAKANLTAAEQEIVRMRKLRSNLYLPIYFREKTVGALIISSFKKPFHFSNEDIALLQGYAGQAAKIIDNIRNHEDLRKHAMELERQNAERASLINDLRLAKEKAEESDRLKSAFLQNLSHEVRTPLNGIVGFSELLKEYGISDAERAQYADIVIERSWQLTSIINDILTISSIETRQERLYEENFNLDALLKNQIEVFSEEAANKNIRLTLDNELDSAEAEVHADKSKLLQILNNLLTNALKFTVEGEVRLGCRKKDEQLEFSVQDNGIGIDSDKLDLIFERFAQADDNIRSNYGGTGLGLSICKGFAEVMGGHIWAESTPGEGSTFYLTLPFRPSQEASVSDSLVYEHINAESGMTILVAEDEESNFLFLNALLNKLGADVIRAHNGQEAIDICKNEVIDLVLMDIKMPILNGDVAANEIRKFKPDLPIIAQTAHAIQSDLAQYGEVFDDYITKPFTKKKLVGVINSHSK